MSFSVTLPPPSVSSFPRPKQHSSSYLENNFHLNFKSNLQQFQTLSRLHLQTQVSRRTQNFPREAPIDEPRNWLDPVDDEDDVDEDEDGDEEDEDEDRSLDLLARFLQNVFKKISKRARKAVRSVLPVSIPTKLVGFSVNGVLVLAFLWVLKAFIEVICTLGSVVFVSILLIRGIWTGINYLQESRNPRINKFDDDHRAWSGTQPAG
ncbi:hypothetical protein RGQ29_005820 [Quercus rubra]|uniref:Uncharacterized protein n=1 Tax=Quercus rubra TaxID=3512 RepID=A0AAN7E5I8_QUERU|nr:hypothetical protein RGQ29_005820 [Quercus rubra]